MKLRLLAFSLVLPSGDIHIVRVVSLGLSFLGLALDTEVTAAGLVPVQGVTCHKLADLEEVLKPEGFLKFLVELILLSWNTNILVEHSLEVVDLLDCLLQTFLAAGHAYILPHDVSQLLVDGVNSLLALDGEESVDSGLNIFLGLVEGRVVDVGLRLGELV